VHPQTDDATVRANFIGVAPEVSGHIVELPVQDNQFVHEGDLLFVIDPRPYELALERAKAALLLTQKEVDALTKGVGVAEVSITRATAQAGATTADIARLEAQRVAAQAALTRAEGELKLAQDQLARVEPLLARQFVTEDQVEQARTKRLVAAMSVEQARTALAGAVAAVEAARAQRHAAVAAVEQAKTERGRAQDNVGQSGDINARVRSAEVAVEKAALDLSYCRVYAPFSGHVVNLNISKGAFARAGADVFTLVDTATWYVVANFRETQLRHIRQGATADIYLQSQPNQHFHGTVVGLGWAVVPDSGTSAMGLPKIDRQLDWVRLAQRFPVRIRLDNPDDSFRIGASAVVTIRDEPPQAARAADRSR
jgi:membrane fusion protein, multidrug efflux system